MIGDVVRGVVNVAVLFIYRLCDRFADVSLRDLKQAREQQSALSLPLRCLVERAEYREHLVVQPVLKRDERYISQVEVVHVDELRKALRDRLCKMKDEDVIIIGRMIDVHVTGIRLIEQEAWSAVIYARSVRDKRHVAALNHVELVVIVKVKFF